MGFIVKAWPIFVLLTAIMCTSCQLPYLIKSAYNQMDLLSSRVPIEKCLQDEEISAEEKRKLKLSEKVREFATSKLGLNSKNIYTSYVKLDRPYVTYAVSASRKWEISSYEWSFPIVGKVPYKGFFQEKEATEEANDLKEQGWDTYVRGVSAYSTLGWFNDPLTSSMLRYHDYDLVNTIIHESVHATLFIKHEANFNERLAVFLGNKGMELFYLESEGLDSRTMKEVKLESLDEKKMAAFMIEKIKNLQTWYKNLNIADRREEDRQTQFRKIENEFNTNAGEMFGSLNYRKMKLKNLNNARLVNFKTYYQDQEDFEKLYLKCHSNFSEFLNQVKEFEKASDPTAALKNLL